MNAARKELRPASALFCALAGFVLFQFWGNATHGYIATNSLFYWWGFQWVNPDSEDQHAWLILALSLFLFWRNLRRSPPDGQSEGFRAAGALLAGLALHGIGYVAQQPRISVVAMLLYAWGVLSLAGRRRWADASAFPLAFMVFAIPVNALDSLGFWLRMGVVRTGAAIAHACGIAVIQNGTQLIAPDGRYQYDVVAACSGVRSLVALSALSLFLGYIWFRPLWLRGAMFLLSFPLVFVGNVLRISAIIFAAAWRGQAAGDRIHDIMGLGVFIVVLAGVLAVADFIARIRPAWAAGTPGAARPAPQGPSPQVVALAVFAVVAAEASFLRHRTEMAPPVSAGVLIAAGGENPVELPTFLDSGWMGSRVEPTAVERSILPPDTGYSRKLYINQEGPGRQTLLSIVLSGRDRSSIHRPELCLVGQGWTIDGVSSHRFSYPGKADSDFKATVLTVHRRTANALQAAPVPEVVVYWYVGDGRVVPSEIERMLCDAWNRVVHGRADRWAYVLLMTDARDGERAAIDRIQAILNSTLPSFQPAVAAAR